MNIPSVAAPGSSAPGSILEILRSHRNSLELFAQKFPGFIHTLSEQYILLLLTEFWLVRNPTTVKALFCYYNGSRGAFATFIKRLQEAQIVTIWENPHDARSKHIMLRDGVGPIVTDMLSRPLTAFRTARTLQPSVKRRRHPLAAIASGAPSLLNALKIWESMRVGDAPPRPTNEKTQLIADAVGRDLTHVIDVSPNEPENYRFTTMGAAGMPALAFFRSTAVGSITVVPYREAVMEDYTVGRHSTTPVLQDIVSRLTETVTLSYSRLLLPFSNDGKTTDGIVSCIFKRPFEDFKVPT